MQMRKIAGAGLRAAAALAVTMPLTLASAQEVTGKPIPAGVNLQRPVTPAAVDMVWLDDMLLVIITAIVVFVTALLLYTVWRFDARRNPTPQRFTHNSTLEVVWTAVPVVILVVIAIPSLRLLDTQLTIPEPEVTIKATGYQWYWGYEYSDHDFGFESFMLSRDDLEEYGYSQDEYLLATDTAVVVPIGKTVVMQVTSADVIHSWTIPAFGVKQDGIPGRLAQLWFAAEKEGIYFGQCSELCGKDHSYMPITVKVVSQEAYDAWLDGAIDEYAGTPRDVTVAAAD